MSDGIQLLGETGVLELLRIPGGGVENAAGTGGCGKGRPEVPHRLQKLLIVATQFHDGLEPEDLTEAILAVLRAIRGLAQPVNGSPAADAASLQRALKKNVIRFPTVPRRPGAWFDHSQRPYHSIK